MVEGSCDSGSGPSKSEAGFHDNPKDACAIINPRTSKWTLCRSTFTALFMLSAPNSPLPKPHGAILKRGGWFTAAASAHRHQHHHHHRRRRHHHHHQHHHHAAAASAARQPVVAPSAAAAAGGAAAAKDADARVRIAAGPAAIVEAIPAPVTAALVAGGSALSPTYLKMEAAKVLKPMWQSPGPQGRPETKPLPLPSCKMGNAKT